MWLRKYSWSGPWGWAENVVDSSWFNWIDTSRFPCWQLDMPEVDLCRQCRVGWRCCRFDLIWLNRRESYESTEVCGHVLRTRKVHVSLCHRFWLNSGGLCRVGWKCCRFDSVLKRNESFPLLSICHAGSRFVRDTSLCESSWVIKCLRQIDSVWVFWTWMTEMLFRKKSYNCAFHFSKQVTK